jgi:hypothetical protein
MWFNIDISFWVNTKRALSFLWPVRIAPSPSENPMNHVNHASETTSGVKSVNALNSLKLKDVSRVISEDP